MYWQRVKRTILARFTLFFLRNPYPELASVDNHDRRYKVKVVTPHAKKRHHFLVIPLLLSIHQSLTRRLPMNL